MPKTISTGTIGTVAGTGEPGYGGDGASAHLACLNEPKNIALDAKDNLYIADSENHLIRKVNVSTGAMTTVAGIVVNGTGEPSRQEVEKTPASDPLPADPLADPVHSLESAYTQTSDISGMVRYVVGQASGNTRFGGDGGPAAKARLNFPSAIVVDRRGVLYIADTWNHRIRRVDPETGVISTIAGTGQAKFSGDGGPASAAALNEPVALALDEQGRLYIADQSNNRVRMIDTNTGVITTVAGNGEPDYTGDGVPAIDAGLSGPSGIALDGEGNVFVSDTFNGRIRKIDARTGLIDTVLGDGSEFRYQPGVNESSSSVSRPYGIGFDQAGDLFLTDSDNHLLRKWSRKTNTVTLVAGNGQAQFEGDGLPPDQSSLNFPFGVAVNAEGSIFIADTFNHRIRMIAV